MSAAIEVLTALSLPRVGAATVRKLIGTDPALDFTTPAGENVAEFLDRASAKDAQAARRKAESILEECEALGISVLTALDSAYPPRLLSLKDYPVALYVKGPVTRLSEVLVAVVGTRNPSPLGAGYATRLARELATRGAGIVSGLALGIDTAAHEGALKAKGTTIAVMAHGLDIISPKSNTGLAERILAAGGVLVSEHEPGIPPFRAEYVRRNRIQSGLSLASIIVESGETGGAMHQARFTRDQNRLLYAFVPPSGAPGEVEFQHGGANRLVSELGAAVISTEHDLDRAWATISR